MPPIWACPLMRGRGPAIASIMLYRILSVSWMPLRRQSKKGTYPSGPQTIIVSISGTLGRSRTRSRVLILPILMSVLSPALAASAK